MAGQNRHRILGEHIYEGMVYGSFVPPDVMDTVKDFDLKGDVLLASYPKTGTTWMQELLWLVNSGGDFQSANNMAIIERVPFLEYEDDVLPSIHDIAKTPHPRLLKTHLAASFYRKQLSMSDFKVVLVIRNPKDTLVSYYHFYRMNVNLGNFEGKWEEFFDDLFLTKHLSYGDYFDWYSSWCQYKDQPNIKMVHYEDMKSNLKAVVEDITAFLGKHLSQEIILKITEHLSFKQMKDNKMTNYSTLAVMKSEISPFMRKGEVGDWKNYFTPEQSEYIDREYRDSLEKAGVQLQFE